MVPFDRKAKAAVMFFLIVNLLLLFVFFVLIICFYDVPAFPVAAFRKLTKIDFTLYMQSGDLYDAITRITHIVGLAVSMIDFTGIQILLYARLYGCRGLPIPTVLKVVVPVAGVLLYSPIYYYIKYRADYFHLYMLLVPVVFLALILLALWLIGITNLRKERQQQ